MSVSFSDFASLIKACGDIRPRVAGQPGSEGSSCISKIFEQWLHTRRASRQPGIGKIVFRLLFPDLDVRRRYDMKETNLSRALLDAMDWPRDVRRSVERWAKADELDVRRSGFLGEQVQEAVEARVRHRRLRPHAGSGHEDCILSACSRSMRCSTSWQRTLSTRQQTV